MSRSKPCALPWAALGMALFAGCSPEAPEQGATAASTSSGTAGASDAQAPSSSLPARRAIAGIAGFQTRSRLVFAAEPGRAHVLDATFLFPGRVRLRLAVEEAQRTERVLAYRHGERGFFIDEGTAVSRELQGDELRELCLQTELRRALFLWPDGFPWSGEGPERSTELASLGKLIARLDPDGRPSAMRSIDVAGNGVEELRAITWQPRKERHFPVHFELCAADQPVWSEDVLSVETSLHYVDAFFLPPDRRGDAETSGGAAGLALDLPAAWELEVQLAGEPAASWAGARSAHARERAQWVARNVELLAGDWTLVDDRGRPSAVLLRAAFGPARPADGWVQRDECPAWGLDVERVEHVDTARISAVRMRANDAKARVHVEFATDANNAETIRLVAASGVAR